MDRSLLPQVSGEEQPIAASFFGQDMFNQPVEHQAQARTTNALGQGQSRMIVGDVKTTFTGSVANVNNYYSSPLEHRLQDQASVVLEWLAPIDHNEPYESALEKLEPGTGAWFLDSAVFQDWLTRPASLLWLHGGSRLLSDLARFVTPLMLELQLAAGNLSCAPQLLNESRSFARPVLDTNPAISL